MDDCTEKQHGKNETVLLQFCSCLKSVSRVAEEVRQLSDDLGLEEVVEGMRKCGNEGAADQAKDTVSTLLSSVGQNLENLLDQFIDAAIDQVKHYDASKDNHLPMIFFSLWYLLFGSS